MAVKKVKKKQGGISGKCTAATRCSANDKLTRGKTMAVKKVKKKQGGISGKPSIMRRNKILLAMAIRALELGSTVDVGKNDPYIDGMLAGISECVNIVKDYDA
jgi:hypothetical protein